MKLRLPSALLMAVLSPAAYGAVTYTYDGKTTADTGKFGTGIYNGLITATFTGDYTSTDLDGANAGSYSTGWIGAINPYLKNNSKNINAAQSTLLKVGNTSSKTTVGTVIGGGPIGYAVTGDKKIQVTGSETTVGTIYGGYVVLNVGTSEYFTITPAECEYLMDYKSVGKKSQYAPKAQKGSNGEYPVIDIAVNNQATLTGNIYGGSYIAVNFMGNEVAALAKTMGKKKAEAYIVDTYSPWALNEKINITVSGGAKIGGSIWGAGQAGSSVNNKVSITVNDAATSITGNIYAGAKGLYYTVDKVSYKIQAYVDSTHVKINNGTVTGDIFAGGQGNGIVKGDTRVDISGGSLNKIYGGGYGESNQESLVKGDTHINLIAGTVNYLYGGGYGKKTGTDIPRSIVEGDTNVTVNGGKVNSVVYGGGGNYTDVLGNTYVTINGGTNANTHIVGGGVANATIGGSTYINITGGTVRNVHGGGNGNDETTIFNNIVKGDTHISVSGGTAHYIYGGGSGHKNHIDNSIVEGNTYIDITNGTFTGNVYGGGLYAIVKGCTNITVSDGNFKQIYGGASGASVGGDTSVLITGGTMNGSIYGGSSTSGTVEGNTSVKISGGKFIAVYGGGNTSKVAGNTYVDITNGTFDGTVYGGGVDAIVKGCTNITVSDGTFNKQIYGGANGGSVGGDTSVLITGGTMNGSIYGGSSNSGTVEGNTSVKISGGNFTAVYGGGHTAKVAGNTLVEVSGGESTSSVGAGGYSGIVSGESKVIISGTADIKYDVFGGGFAEGSSSGQSTVVLTGGKIGRNVYGSGRQGAVVEKDAKVILQGNGAEVGGSIYGVGDGGTVKGNCILSFDHYTANEDTEGYAQVNWLKADGETAVFQNFNMLEMSGSKLNLGDMNEITKGNNIIGKITINNSDVKTSNIGAVREFAFVGNEQSVFTTDQISISEDDSLLIKGENRTAAHFVLTGSSTEPALWVDGTANISGATLEIQGEESLLGIGSGSLIADNAVVDLSEAAGLIIDTAADESTELIIQNGAVFNAGNNVWLGNGDILVTGKDSALNVGGGEDSATYLAHGSAAAVLDTAGETVESNLKIMNGGRLNILSGTTYVGGSQVLNDESADKLANLDIGKDSSASFQTLEIFADANVNFIESAGDNVGFFSATNINVHEGGSLNMTGTSTHKGEVLLTGNNTIESESVLSVDGSVTISETALTVQGNQSLVEIGSGSLVVDNAVVDLSEAAGLRINDIANAADENTELIIQNGAVFNAGNNVWLGNGDILVTGDGSAFNAGGGEDSATYLGYVDASDNTGNVIPEAAAGVVSTIKAADGGQVNIQSEHTYIGTAQNADSGISEHRAAIEIGKNASVAFKNLSVYSDTNVDFTDGDNGLFTATTLNLTDAASLSFYGEGAVTLEDISMSENAILMSSGQVTILDELMIQNSMLSFLSDSLGTPDAAVDVAISLGDQAQITSWDGVVFNIVFEYAAVEGLLTDPSASETFMITVMDGLAHLSDSEALIQLQNCFSVDKLTLNGINAENELVDLFASDVALVFDETSGTLTVTGTASATKTIKPEYPNVPEPSTATLSLLALAALAARRRRSA